MSTYSSDEELSLPRILDGHDKLLTFADVASSYVNNDVRLCLGECEFYMAPAVADQLAAALTRQARRAERFQG